MTKCPHCGALFLAALCLTVVAWYYGGPLWTQMFLLERNFDSNPGASFSLFAALWGYELVLSFVAGGGLAYFLRTAHPLRWTIAFGAVLTMAHMAFSRPEVLDADHWSDYAIFLAGLVAPLVGAALGGILATSLRNRANGGAVV